MVKPRTCSNDSGSVGENFGEQHDNLVSKPVSSVYCSPSDTDNAFGEAPARSDPLSTNQDFGGLVSVPANRGFSEMEGSGMSQDFGDLAMSQELKSSQMSQDFGSPCARQHFGSSSASQVSSNEFGNQSFADPLLSGSFRGQPQSQDFGAQSSNQGFGGQTSNQGFTGQPFIQGFGGESFNPGFGGQYFNQGFGCQVSNQGFGGLSPNQVFGGQSPNQGFGDQATSRDLSYTEGETYSGQSEGFSQRNRFGEQADGDSSNRSDKNSSPRSDSSFYNPYKKYEPENTGTFLNNNNYANFPHAQYVPTPGQPPRTSTVKSQQMSQAVRYFVAPVNGTETGPNQGRLQLYKQTTYSRTTATQHTTMPDASQIANSRRYGPNVVDVAGGAQRDTSELPSPAGEYHVGSGMQGVDEENSKLKTEIAQLKTMVDHLKRKASYESKRAKIMEMTIDNPVALKQAQEMIAEKRRKGLLPPKKRPVEQGQ